jgi:phosphatidylinositol alpha-1,6-mannosyltransferase
MKSLLISHDFLPGLSGGISAFYHRLCAQLGSEIQVLAPKSGDWRSFDPKQSYVIHRQAMPMVPTTFMRQMRIQAWHVVYLAYVAAAQFALLAFRGCWLTARERVDLLLIGHLYLLPLGWLIRSITGRPYAVILHGSELRRYWHIGPVKKLFTSLLDRASFVVVNSESTHRQYLERGVRVDQDFVRVHPGIDTEHFCPGADPLPILRRYDLQGKAVVLTVARLVEWKGQDVVIRAMRRVVNVVPSAVYLVIGEGPYRPDLERLVDELGLCEHVVFAGFVQDKGLVQAYAAASLMILVGREVQPGMPIEGFGIAYTEASACGRPVIGSRMGGAVEAVEDGVTGLLVDPYDEKEIAQAIVRLLTDAELAQEMGQRGRDRAVREFDWRSQADQLRHKLHAVARAGPAA